MLLQNKSMTGLIKKNIKKVYSERGGVQGPLKFRNACRFRCPPQTQTFSMLFSEHGRHWHEDKEGHSGWADLVSANSM